VNGIEFIWCNKCNCWWLGNNKHTTSNRKPKAELWASSNSGQGGQDGSIGNFQPSWPKSKEHALEGNHPVAQG
jgi:hypothetical protein